MWLGDICYVVPNDKTWHKIGRLWSNQDHISGAMCPRYAMCMYGIRIGQWIAVPYNKEDTVPYINGPVVFNRNRALTDAWIGSRASMCVGRAWSRDDENGSMWGGVIHVMPLYDSLGADGALWLEIHNDDTGST